MATNVAGSAGRTDTSMLIIICVAASATTIPIATVWYPVGRSLAALPNDYGAGEAYQQYVAARERSMDYLIGVVPAVKALLTPAQRRKLPPIIVNYLDERVLKFLRSSTAGDGSSLVARP